MSDSILQEWSDLFELKEEVLLPPTEEIFVSQALKLANVGSVASRFYSLFPDEKIEAESEGKVIKIYRLKKTISNKVFLDSIKGKIAVKLIHIFQLIKQQSKGEEGALAVKDGANYAIVEDDGNYWVLSIFWNPMGKYWSIVILPDCDYHTWYENECLICL